MKECAAQWQTMKKGQQDRRPDLQGLLVELHGQGRAGCGRDARRQTRRGDQADHGLDRVQDPGLHRLRPRANG